MDDQIKELEAEFADKTKEELIELRDSLLALESRLEVIWLKEKNKQKKIKIGRRRIWINYNIIAICNVLDIKKGE